MFCYAPSIPYDTIHSPIIPFQTLPICSFTYSQTVQLDYVPLPSTNTVQDIYCIHSVKERRKGTIIRGYLPTVPNKSEFT